jgi:ubiquinone/menaquinone biosynthesis C-methylase UbiE
VLGVRREDDLAGPVAADAEKVHHPIFARLFTRLSAHAEERGQAEHRRAMLAGLAGRVVEVGAGNGLNFAHYPQGVEEVVAVEPEAYLRDQAARAATRAPVRVTVVEGLADRLPLEDGSVAAGVASLVLCSVPDPAAALRELRRVIRPGGELRFYEHVISERPGLARLQRIAERSGFWPLVGGGCHPARDTAAAIEAAGFEIESCRRFDFRPALIEKVVEPKILGVARRS